MNKASAISKLNFFHKLFIACLLLILWAETSASSCSLQTTHLFPFFSLSLPHSTPAQLQHVSAALLSRFLKMLHSLHTTPEVRTLSDEGKPRVAVPAVWHPGRHRSALLEETCVECEVLQAVSL